MSYHLIIVHAPVIMDCMHCRGKPSLLLTLHVHDATYETYGHGGGANRLVFCSDDVVLALVVQSVLSIITYFLTVIPSLVHMGKSIDADPYHVRHLLQTL